MIFPSRALCVSSCCSSCCCCCFSKATQAGGLFQRLVRRQARQQLFVYHDAFGALTPCQSEDDSYTTDDDAVYAATGAPAPASAPVPAQPVCPAICIAALACKLGVADLVRSLKQDTLSYLTCTDSVFDPAVPCALTQSFSARRRLLAVKLVNTL